MKYKLWCDDNKEWENDDWVVLPDGNFAWLRDGAIVPPTKYSKHVLLKGTGIKDVNGMEIFELDLVKYSIQFKDKVIVEHGVVMFDEGLFFIKPVVNTYENGEIFASIEEKQVTDILRNNNGLLIDSNVCEAQDNIYGLKILF